MSVTKNTFSLAGNELHTKTSAGMVTYGGNSTVEQKLDEILNSGGQGSFAQQILSANSAQDVRRLLNIYPEIIYDECGNHWDIKGNTNFTTYNNEPAFYFDGETYLSHSGNFAIGAENFTVSAKFAFEVVPESVVSLFSAYNTTGVGPNFQLGTTANKLLRFFYKNSSGTIYNYTSSNSTIAVLNYFFSWQYDFDNKTCYLYSNGNPVGSGAINNTANIRFFRIGTSANTTVGNFFQGHMSHFKISNSLEVASSDSDFVKDSHTLSLIHFEA